MAKPKSLFQESRELAEAAVNPKSEESLFRDSTADLRKQHLGPSFWNTQRIYELADMGLYSGLYSVPATLAGAGLGGPLGAALGFGVGNKLGTLHSALQEYERLRKAKKTFTKEEKVLLNKLNKSFNRGGAVGAILGGLGGAGLGYISTPQDAAPSHKYIYTGLGAFGTAAIAGLLGGLISRGITREKLRNTKALKKIIEQYD